MKVSIVITAYNVDKYIEKCIKSAIAQTYKNIEIIVVNDYSTDNTKTIIEKFPVKLINNETNMGAGISRRVGINAATGDYVMLLDADDWLESKCIESLVNGVENYDIVFCGRNVIKNDKIVDSIKYENKIYNDIYSALLNQNVQYLSSCIIKRELYNLVEYSDFRYIEDMQTLYKIAYYANAIKTIDYVGYNYLLRDDSLCNSASDEKTKIYTSLAIIDMINFFNEKDKTIINKLNLKQALVMNVISFSNGNRNELNNYTQEIQQIRNFITENKIWI